jgi:hypothetical protein
MTNCIFGNLPVYDEGGFKVSASEASKLKYKCPYEAMANSSYCIFHDPDYYKKNPNDYLNAVYKLITDPPRNNQYYLIGLNFPQKLNVHRRTFNVPFYFSLSKGDEAMFMSVNFSKAEFIETIVKNLSFLLSSFRDGNFTFSQMDKLFLLGCIFKNARFLKTKSKEFNCVGTIFCNSSFQSTDFYDGYFYECTFNNAIFQYNNFYNKFNFRNSYLNEILFRQVEFKEEIQFYDVIFPTKKEFIFDWDSIPGKDSRKLLRFLKIKLNLYWIIPNEVAIEKRTNVSNELIIIQSNYNDERHSLSLAKFSTYVELNIDDEDTHVFSIVKQGKKSLIYEINDYYANLDFKDLEKIPVQFNYCKSSEGIHFKGESDKPIDLSFVSFKGTDLTNFKFDNVEWLSKKEFFFSRSVVIDEILMEKFENFGEVSKIYNQLRKNYESRLAFNEASNFYIGEMECIRKAFSNKSKLGKLQGFLYWVYKWLGMYGESIALPLMWTVITISFFAIFVNSTTYAYLINI